MDSNNNESTSVATETDNNAWQLVTAPKDDIDTLTSLFEEYKDIDLAEAREKFEYAFEDAQRAYNEVVDEANDKLKEIRQLIEKSDWGKSLINYEDQHDGCNPTLHKLLQGLTGIDDFLYDHDRHDGYGFEFYDNGSSGNSDGISSLIEDLGELEKFDETLLLKLLDQCKKYKHLLNELIKDGEIHCMEDRDELIEVLFKLEK